MITCPSDKFFHNLCGALEIDLSNDARFADVDQRMQNEEELDALLHEHCRRFDREDLVERLVSADVLTAPIKNIPEVVDDPQVLHNEMVVETEHITEGAIRVTGVPVKLHGTPGAVHLPPPLLGQHTEDLLAELDYTADEIESLRRDHLVATHLDLQRDREERRNRRQGPPR